ncbi:hypothetical protein [Alkalihalobacillus pseudalcaliphilus]|uniref:hypothetical protein n=1 Tax=Alkalihalobacillus pseudalcaliphilus TaxID=79884 RepID=UPI00064DFE21|nr:hypothetical protein [Alkalihalobacillus pseudalcaliphilus]KMK74975.1 hypothetical protein AB990_15980 [Alkalihalobacillus pseudalcaliphilus]
MENNKKTGLYFYATVGTIGLLFILIGLARYLELSHDLSYLILSFGFILTMSYIHYLERLAGLSKGFVWGKAGISILMALIVFYFFVYKS